MNISEEIALFKNLTDEQLVQKYRDGDKAAQDFLIDKYKNLVKIKTRSYFMAGADNDDLVQEGMIGLYKAIRDFNFDKQTSFYTFAEVCILRQILTAIKTSTRQKHIPLNSSISLNKPMFEEENDEFYIDLITATNITSPEDLFINKEQKRSLEKQLSNSLTKLELKVLSFFLQGKTYAEIAIGIEKDEKSIDNALQRIKRKVYEIQKANKQL